MVMKFWYTHFLLLKVREIPFPAIPEVEFTLMSDTNERQHWDTQDELDGRIRSKSIDLLPKWVNMVTSKQERNWSRYHGELEFWNLD